ncbi:MAG: hypothetical protein Q7I97_05325 [Thermovirgaceae bacterium]|nr:hypothetical protein [Thermovirgaceae bacterium]
MTKEIQNSEGKDEKSRRSPITTLLFITVTLALAVKMVIRIPAAREFFSGYGKFIFLPVLVFLGYIGTQRKK